MTVNVDAIAAALGNPAVDRIIIDKATISNMATGQFCSLWRATGQPGQASIPTSAAIPTSATTGAISFTNQTAPIYNFILWLYAQCGNSAQSPEIWDRVAHYGGLVLNSTSAQNLTGMDLSAGSLNLGADRRGASNYSDIQWWLEVYTDGGATASNATINVTFNDASTANLSVQAVGGTLRAGRLIPLTPLIPTGSQGKFIRGINSVTLSASTGTAGNFGFTAVRPRTVFPLPVVNTTSSFDWAQLGLPLVPNDACLMLAMLCSTTSSGALRGGGKIGALTV